MAGHERQTLAEITAGICRQFHCGETKRSSGPGQAWARLFLSKE
jgi:hypothetical protein